MTLLAGGVAPQQRLAVAVGDLDDRDRLQWIPWLANVAYASARSSGNTSTAPSASEQFSGRSVPMPSRWAISTTRSCPTASASLTWKTLLDSVMASTRSSMPPDRS